MIKGSRTIFQKEIRSFSRVIFDDNDVLDVDDHPPRPRKHRCVDSENAFLVQFLSDFIHGISWRKEASDERNSSFAVAIKYRILILILIGNL